MSEITIIGVTLGLVTMIGISFGYEKFGILSKKQDYLATIDYRQNFIQLRRTPDGFWSTLGSDTRLRNGNSLRTGVDSEAVVKLKSGTTIHFDSASAMLFEKKSRLTTLLYQNGSFLVRTSSALAGEELEIILGEHKLKINSGSCRIETNSSNDLVINPDGDIRLTDGAGITHNLNSRQMALITASGVSVLVKNIRMIGPFDNERIFIKSGMKMVEFTWQNQLKSDEIYLIEISSNRDFTDVSHAIAVEQNRITIPLAPGKYFWRISTMVRDLAMLIPKDKRKRSRLHRISEDENPEEVELPDAMAVENYSGHIRLTGEISRLIIKKQTTFELIYPRQNEKVKLPPGTQQVSFNWLKSDAFYEYLFEISQDRDLSRILERRRIKSNNITMQLKNARYYWRITGIGHFPGSNYTTPISGFQVYTGEALNATHLNWPRPDSEFDFTGSNGDGILFVWTPVGEYHNFTLLISEEEDFSNVVFKSDTVNNFFQLREELPAGSYWWKVAHRIKQGKQIESNLARFVIKARAPAAEAELTTTR